MAKEGIIPKIDQHVMSALAPEGPGIVTLKDIGEYYEKEGSSPTSSHNYTTKQLIPQGDQPSRFTNRTGIPLARIKEQRPHARHDVVYFNPNVITEEEARRRYQEKALSQPPQSPKVKSEKTQKPLETGKVTSLPKTRRGRNFQTPIDTDEGEEKLQNEEENGEIDKRIYRVLTAEQRQRIIEENPDISSLPNPVQFVGIFAGDFTMFKITKNNRKEIQGTPRTLLQESSIQATMQRREISPMLPWFQKNEIQFINDPIIDGIEKNNNDHTSEWAFMVDGEHLVISLNEKMNLVSNSPTRLGDLLTILEKQTQLSRSRIAQIALDIYETRSKPPVIEKPSPVNRVVALVGHFIGEPAFMSEDMRDEIKSLVPSTAKLHENSDDPIEQIDTTVLDSGVPESDQYKKDIKTLLARGISESDFNTQLIPHATNVITRYAHMWDSITTDASDNILLYLDQTKEQFTDSGEIAIFPILRSYIDPIASRLRELTKDDPTIAIRQSREFSDQNLAIANELIYNWIARYTIQTLDQYKNTLFEYNLSESEMGLMQQLFDEPQHITNLRLHSSAELNNQTTITRKDVDPVLEKILFNRDAVTQALFENILVNIFLDGDLLKVPFEKRDDASSAMRIVTDLFTPDELRALYINFQFDQKRKLDILDAQNTLTQAQNNKKRRRDQIQELTHKLTRLIGEQKQEIPHAIKDAVLSKLTIDESHDEKNDSPFENEARNRELNKAKETLLRPFEPNTF